MKLLQIIDSLGLGVAGLGDTSNQVHRTFDGIAHRWNAVDILPDIPVEYSPWLFLSVILGVAALAAVIVRLRHISLEKQQRILKNLVATRTAELEKLAGLAETINSAVLPEQVLQHVYDSFRPTIPYDRIGFGEITEDGLSLRAVWACSDGGEMQITKGFEAPMVGSSLEKILRTGEPRIIDDLEAYLEAHPTSNSTRLIVAEGMRSSLTCPLKAGHHQLGFLFFSSRKQSSYTDVHVQFFQQIAGQLSYAIEKSRLYSDLLQTRRNLEEANRSLAALASRDGLTGLVNRRTLDIRLDEEWRRSIRSKIPLTLLMIDIDHFKMYNDTFGHVEGDECLKKVAEVLEQSFQRSGECVARYGGEEFAVILPDLAAEDAVDTAIRFIENLETVNIPHHASPVQPRVTVSIGIATVYPQPGASVASLVFEADRSLYMAKQEGRNRCHQARAGVKPT